MNFEFLLVCFQRDYYMTLLTRWTDISMDELDSIESEWLLIKEMILLT